MCLCGLTEGVHWYIDMKVAGYMYQIAETPEQAEYHLRRWAARILRLGHVHTECRYVAARILATKRLNMVAVCESKIAHESLFSDGLETKDRAL